MIVEEIDKNSRKLVLDKFLLERPGARASMLEQQKLIDFHDEL
jgi:hypothetical protein